MPTAAAATAHRVHRYLRRALIARRVAHDRSDRAGYVAADLNSNHAVVLAGHSSALRRMYDALTNAFNGAIDETTVMPEDAAVSRPHADLLAAIERRNPAEAQLIAGSIVNRVVAVSPAVGR